MDGHCPYGSAEAVTDAFADDDHEPSQGDAVDHCVQRLVRQLRLVTRERLHLGEGQERAIGQRVARGEQDDRLLRAELQQFEAGVATVWHMRAMSAVPS